MQLALVTTLLCVIAPLRAQQSGQPAPEPPVVVVHDATELRAALSAARPGTTIAIAPGDYAAVAAAGIRGADDRPVVVRAANAAEPPRFTAGLHLSDVEHVVLEDLTFENAPSNGLNIDDGGTFASPSHHLVLRRLRVRDIGGAGNHDGIKLSGVVDFVVEHCTIERWGRNGSGIDLVGCQRGRVEHCTLRDRADRPAANGVQLKGGSRDVVVRHCRFDDAGQRAVQLGGSTGREFFRPEPQGFEAKDLIVEGCTFVGSVAPIAFVGCDGAVVRHNTFVRPGKWLLRILQESRGAEFVPCRNGVFTDNLVVHTGLAPAVNIGPDTAPQTFTFARTWWWNPDAPAHSQCQLPLAERDPAGGRDPQFVDAANGDLRLRPDSPARAHGATSLPEPPTSSR